MPKYDDFGRPIYETAEEYNRAHKRDGSARISKEIEPDVLKQGITRQSAHNQTAAQRHANREGTKKAKTLVLALISFFIAIIVMIVFSLFGMIGASYEEAVREPNYNHNNAIVEDENQTVTFGDTDTPLPEGYENFTCNGVWITLPSTCKEMAELGYEIETYKLTDVVPADFWECISLIDDDGYSVAMISLTNKTGYDISVAECSVEYFYINNLNIYDEEEEVPDFMFGDNLTFESSYEEVEAYLGAPYYHYEADSEKDSYDSYEWTYYGEGECQRVIINFYNGEMSDVTIEKDVYEE